MQDEILQIEDKEYFKYKEDISALITKIDICHTVIKCLNDIIEDEENKKSYKKILDLINKIKTIKNQETIHFIEIKIKLLIDAIEFNAYWNNGRRFY